MAVSDDDFARLSAFHDGELDGAATAAISARLAAEPDLREALAGIAELSEALRALRPAVEAPTRRLVRLPLGWGMALAATIVAVALLGVLVRGGIPGGADTPAEWHRHFLAQSYDADGTLAPTPAVRWVGNEPDLSLAHLTLVDLARERSGDVYLHYSGFHGCRLTFGTHPTTPKLGASAEGLLVASWSSGGLHYSLLAEGMDAARFHAIAALLKEETKQGRPDSSLLYAMRDTTEHARPCA